MLVIKSIIKKVFGIPSQCAAVIAAAGSSERMGGIDKLFVEIGGVPVLVHTLSAFSQCDYIDEIVVVVRKDMVETVAAMCDAHQIDKVTKVMAGGTSRLESVINGVFAVSWKTELIAIHDGARPCIDQKTIEKTILKATKRHAAAPGIPVSSTLKKIKRDVVLETIDRQDLVEIQTPQTFNADLIKGALTKAMKDSPDITDDCMAVELLNIPIYITQGSRNNIKLTTAEDIDIAKALLLNR
ncbi:MAG: 2-C-methyl-D-erythritol 4-phosphate cytidylyltransferase [Oscillospiraceae bacterium]|nr:2-C-methyl-D-erythritol 4-phosphate cytidylyltransferase [Oscillospiraceae bacterium]